MRRNALGLSRRALAERLGATEATIRLFEAGDNQEVLSVGFVNRLAAVLGTDLSTLLLDPRANQAVDSHEVGPEGDVEPRLATALGAELQSDPAVLGAVLAAYAGDRLRQTDILLALDWSGPRFRAALKELRRQLAGAGFSVIYSRGHYLLAAQDRLLNKEQWLAINRAREAGRGLGLQAARYLATVIGRSVDHAWAHNSRQRRIAIAHLEKVGYIQAEPFGYRVSKDVRYSLCLDE